jgi:hypothetical protein
LAILGSMAGVHAFPDFASLLGLYGRRRASSAFSAFALEHPHLARVGVTGAAFLTTAVELLDKRRPRRLERLGSLSVLGLTGSQHPSLRR